MDMYVFCTCYSCCPPPAFRFSFHHKYDCDQNQVHENLLSLTVGLADIMVLRYIGVVRNPEGMIVTVELNSPFSKSDMDMLY